MENYRKGWGQNTQTGRIAQIGRIIWVPRKVFEGTLYDFFRMSQLGKTQQVCAFCTLVIQIGYDELTPDDIAKVSVHMRIAHHLKRYDVPA